MGDELEGLLSYQLKCIKWAHAYTLFLTNQNRNALRTKTQCGIKYAYSKLKTDIKQNFLCQSQVGFCALIITFLRTALILFHGSWQRLHLFIYYCISLIVTMRRYVHVCAYIKGG